MISSLGNLATLAPEAFDRLTSLTARLLRSPVSLVTAVEEDRQLILGEWGLGEPWKTMRHMPLEYSYCQYALDSAVPLTIPDARLDPRVSDSPAVTENQSIAYLGIPLVLERGKVLGTLCVVDIVPRDWTHDEIATLQALAASVITELSLRAEARQRDLHAQRLDTLGQVAAGVAHDFRNILTAIVTNASLLETEIAADDPLREEVNEIQAAAGRASALTKQLLDFSRARPREYAPLDVRDAVSSLAPILQRVIGRERSLVVRSSAVPLPTIMDRGEFDQVLLNLVINGRDASAPGTRISVATYRREMRGDKANGRRGSYAVISVKDNGSGIPPEVLARMFEPFFTTKAENGNGIGLATVRKVVEEVGGFIDVKSKVGRGSRFAVHLPLTRARSDAFGSGPLASAEKSHAAATPRAAYVLALRRDLPKDVVHSSPSAA